MFIRRVNDTTIRCIITAQDLEERGIGIDDLFDRKQEAVEYIKSVIAQAAKTENFNVQGEFTSMKLSVLPDHSVSLTLSQDPGEHKVIRQAVEGAVPEVIVKEDAYAYRFETMRSVAKCCRAITAGGKARMDGALYRDDDGSYLMIFLRGKGGDEDFESRVLSANEFGTLITSEKAVIAFIREHIHCIMKKDAVNQIAALYD